MTKKTHREGLAYDDDSGWGCLDEAALCKEGSPNFPQLVSVGADRERGKGNAPKRVQFSTLGSERRRRWPTSRSYCKSNADVPAPHSIIEAAPDPPPPQLVNRVKPLPCFAPRPEREERVRIFRPGLGELLSSSLLEVDEDENNHLAPHSI